MAKTVAMRNKGFGAYKVFKKNFRRRPFRRNFKRKRFAKAVRAIATAAIRKKDELKYAWRITTATLPVDGTVSTSFLNLQEDIPIGTGANERIGNKIHVVSCILNYSLTASVLLNTVQIIFFRVIVYKAKPAMDLVNLQNNLQAYYEGAFTNIYNDPPYEQMTVYHDTHVQKLNHNRLTYDSYVKMKDFNVTYSSGADVEVPRGFNALILWFNVNGGVAPDWTYRVYNSFKEI